MTRNTRMTAFNTWTRLRSNYLGISGVRTMPNVTSLFALCIALSVYCLAFTAEYMQPSRSIILEQLSSLGVIVEEKDGRHSLQMMSFKDASQIARTLVLASELGSVSDIEAYDCVLDDSHARLLSKIHTLRVLHLSNSRISDTGVKSISECKNLISIELSCSNVSDEIFGILGCLRRLKRLDLSESLVTGKGIDALRASASLQVLSLRSCGLTSEGIRDIGMLGGLVKLDLSNTDIHDWDLDNLSGLVDLQELDLSGTRIEGGGLGALSAMRELWWLNLNKHTPAPAWKWSVDEKGARLVPWNKKETEAFRDGLAAIRDANKTALDRLPLLPKLRSLHLVAWHIDRNDIARLSEFPSLSQIDLEGTDVSDDDVDALGSLEQVEELLVDYTRISVDGRRRLREMLGADVVLTRAERSRSSTKTPTREKD